jgi:NAD(P)-dependent dehydrogenase (short-subunit alcohol dehydrogenase family)
MDIKGKTALVTGGAHRIGGAITLSLARSGANVVINYHRSSHEVADITRQVESLGVQALPFQADISSYAQVENMVKYAGERFGGVDILVNSASQFTRTPLPVEDVTQWEKVIRIQLFGAFYCSNLVAPYMLGNKEGAIINIVDNSAWQPWKNFSAHSVAKTALLGLTRQLALDLAPYVHVNAVAPGPVLPPDNISPEGILRTARQTLLERWGNPGDVVEAVLFLLRSDYITGESIVVDGGQRLAHCR